MAQRPTSTTEPRQAPARLMQFLNPVISGLLRTPLHRLLRQRLIRRYEFPVGYTRGDERVLLTMTASRWWRNLRGGAPVSLRLRGRRRRGQADVITDITGLRDGYRLMLAAHPHMSGLLGITLDDNGEVSLEDARHAQEAGRVVVRVTLTGHEPRWAALAHRGHLEEDQQTSPP